MFQVGVCRGQGAKFAVAKCFFLSGSLFLLQCYFTVFFFTCPDGILIETVTFQAF